MKSRHAVLLSLFQYVSLTVSGLVEAEEKTRPVMRNSITLVHVKVVLFKLVNVGVQELFHLFVLSFTMPSLALLPMGQM